MRTFIRPFDLVVLLFLVAVLALSLVALVVVSGQTSRLQSFDDRIAAGRQENFVSIAVSDRQLCRTIRKQALDRAGENYRNRFQTLKILNVEATPEVLQIAERNYRKDLRRYRLSECEKLKSVTRARELFGPKAIPEL